MSDYTFLLAELDGEVLKVALDSTSNVSEKFSSRLNTFIFEDGQEGADNIVNKNNVISFSGIISDVKSNASGFLPLSTDAGNEDEIEDDLNFTPPRFIVKNNTVKYYSTADLREKLLQIRANKIPVTVHLRDLQYPNCYLTDIQFSQDQENGTFRSNVARYKVSIKATQIRLGSRAFESTVSDADFGRYYQEKSKASAASQAPSVEAEENLNTSASQTRREAQRNVNHR